MKKLVLLLCGMLIAMQNSFAVEEGLYYCTPAHAAHLLQADDGSVTELMVDTADVVHSILIGADTIEIADSRSAERKLVNIVSNDVQGPILGRTETRQFYMDDILHYFYGSMDANNTVAYAEAGICSRFSHREFMYSLGLLAGL